MEQNNYEQYTAGNEQREPLPTMDYPGYTPVVEQPRPQNYSQVTESANSAFGKGLAATIMAEFPVTSLIAIFMGAAGLKKVKQTNEMAAYYGIKAPGKNIAAKVLSMIGLITGIAMTAFWSLYFFIFAIAILASM